MIPSRAFADKTVAVFGLARTGLGAVRALVAGGTKVIAWDDSSTARDSRAARMLSSVDVHGFQSKRWPGDTATDFGIARLVRNPTMAMSTRLTSIHVVLL